MITNNPTFLQFSKFSGVGVVNTLIHLLITVSLVEQIQADPVIANTSAFLAANTFSYWANSRWSFRSEMTRKRFGKFFVVSVAGLSLTIALSSLAKALHWHYLAGVALLFCAMPILTFVSHKFWTYSE